MFAAASSWPYVLIFTPFGLALPCLLSYLTGSAVAFYTNRGLIFILFCLGTGIVWDGHRKQIAVQRLRRARRISSMTAQRPSLFASTNKLGLDLPDKNSHMQQIKAISHLLFSLLVAAFYGFLLMPFFTSLNDTGRLCFIVLVHPIVVEFLDISVRAHYVEAFFVSFKTQKEAEERDVALHNISATVINFTLASFLFAFMRRCLISTMKTPATTTIAVSFCLFSHLVCFALTYTLFTFTFRLWQLRSENY